MAASELHVIGALRNKRSEQAALVKALEQKLGEHRAALTHLDAILRLFAPEIRAEEIRPRQRRRCNVWIRPGECLRLVYDVLCDALQLLTTRELVERMTAMKGIAVSDDRQRGLIQKTVLVSLSRVRDIFERVETGGAVGWQVRQVARAPCQ